MKRVLSILLAALLVLTCLPLAIFAADGDEYAFSSDFATDKDITFDAEAATVTYGGDWRFAVIDPTKGVLVEVPRTSDHSERTNEHGYAITSIAYDGVQANGWSIWYWGSHPGSGGLKLDDLTIGFTNGQTIPAWTYTVPEEGDFIINPSFSSFVAPATAGVNYYLAIFVNEKMVWPVYGSAFSGASPYEVYNCQDGSWYKITPQTTLDEVNEALETAAFTAKKGDRIEFAFRMGPNDDTSMTDSAAQVAQREDGNRVNCTPVVKAKALTDADSAPRYVTVMQDNTTVFTGAVTTPTYEAPEYTGSFIFLGWDVNADGQVDYLPGEEVLLRGESTVLTSVTVGQDRFIDNMPTMQNGIVSFHGNWTIGRYGVNTGAYDLYTTPDGGGTILTVTGSPWGGTGGGLYVAGDAEKFALSGATADGEWAGQIQYTVPYNGTVSVDFTKLHARRELNSSYADTTTAGGYVEGKIEYDFAFYKNGEKVWPSATDWWHYDSGETYTNITQTNDILPLYHAAIESDPVAIKVEIGDTIEFRVRQGNAECWMVFYMPVINYTEVTDTPMVHATSVTVAEDLSLNMFVSLNSQFTREGAKAGLLYWADAQANYDPATGTKLEAGEVNGDLTCFTYSDIAAKQMSDDIYVLPYSYIEGEEGSEVYGSVVPCSIVRYAQSALGSSAELDAQIIALLNYGADAQNFFNYNRDFPANAILSEEQKEAGSLDCESVYAQSSDGTNGANIKSVSLLMNNRIGMKFMIDKVEGVSAYTLQVSRTADFAEYDEVEMVATESGSEYKGIYEVENSDINTTFYIRVATGDTYGNVLTYSVDSYVARMNEDASDSLYYAIYWLSVIGDLAA